MYCNVCDIDWPLLNWEEDKEKKCPSCKRKTRVFSLNDLAVLLNDFRVILEEKEREDAPYGYGIKFISDFGPHLHSVIDTTYGPLTYRETFEDLIVYISKGVKSNEFIVIEWIRPGLVYINSIDHQDDNGFLMISKLPFNDPELWE